MAISKRSAPDIVPTQHDIDWVLVVYAIRGDGYEKLPDDDAKNEMLRRTWRFTDAYGEVGIWPPQGWDWSGIRDSSPEAIARIATEARAVLKKHGVPVPTKRDLGKTAVENIRARREVEQHLEHAMPGIVAELAKPAAAPQAPAPEMDRPAKIAWIVRTHAALAAPGSDVERALLGLLAPWSPDVAAAVERIARDVEKL